MNYSTRTSISSPRRAAIHASRAMALLIAAGFVQTTRADVISWIAGDGWWFNANNWSLNRTPDRNDIIRIGDQPGVSNHLVTMGGQGGSSYDRFELSNGMTLDLNGSELVSFGEAWITGTNTRLIARPSPGPNQRDFQGILRLGTGSVLDLRDNVGVRVFGDSWSNGVITGRGEFLIASVTAFRNDGMIRPDHNGGLTVTQGQSSRYAIDLDGAMGNGQLQLDTMFSVLHVNASALSDSLSGTINMVPGTLLDMNIDDGWSLDSGGVLNVAGFNNPAAASQITGTAIDFGGTMNVGGAQGHLRVLAPLSLQSTAVVNIGDGEWVEFDGQNTVLGGAYNIGQGGKIDFDGVTTMRGGVFNTPSANLADGSVNINGATQWNGTVTINGAARQNGNATVTGASVINADLFDMDGATGSTSWNVNNNLVVNADQIATLPGNRFDGTMSIAGGVLPRLVMNLDDPNASWTMGGTMNLSGSTQLFETRVSGSRLNVEGDLNVTGGRVQISADTTFSNAGGGANVNIGPASAILRMSGETIVRDGVGFSGLGTFQNSTTGNMTLADGVSLGQVGLVNQGVLDIGLRAGAASVDRFQNPNEGTWIVGLGGYAQGNEYDLLIVSGGSALLGGFLNVDLIDVGSGVFMPNEGDEFAILTSTAGVSGVFLNDPTSQLGAVTYEWSVLYEPNAVILHLDHVVPTPGSFALLALGGVCAGGRRRRVTSPR